MSTLFFIELRDKCHVNSRTSLHFILIVASHEEQFKLTVAFDHLLLHA